MSPKPQGRRREGKLTSALPFLIEIVGSVPDITLVKLAAAVKDEYNMIVLFLSGSGLVATLLCLERPNLPERKYDIDEVVKKTPWHRLDEFKGEVPAEERFARTEANGLGGVMLTISPDHLSEIVLASILGDGPQLLWHEQGARSLNRLISRKDAARLRAEGWKEVTDFPAGRLGGPTT